MLSKHEQTAGTAAPFSATAVAVAPVEPNEDNTADRTIAYAPRFVVGGARHPGVIVEPPGLANVEPPPIHYRPCLPRELSDAGKLSAMQIERIIYTGQAHEQRLPDGS